MSRERMSGVDPEPRIELALNLKTATALGLTILPPVLLRADDFTR